MDAIIIHYIIHIYIPLYSHQCWWNPNIHIVCRKARNHPFLLSTSPDFRIDMRRDAVWQHLPQLLRRKNRIRQCKTHVFSMGKSCAKWLRIYLYIRYKICMYIYVYNTVYMTHEKKIELRCSMASSDQRVILQAPLFQNGSHQPMFSASRPVWDPTASSCPAIHPSSRRY